MRQSDRVERMKRVSTRRRYVSLAASAVFRFNDSTLQRLRSNGQAFNPWHAIVRRLPDDGGTGESLHLPGSTRRLQPITIPSWARARMRRGARPWQRSRSRRSCRVGYWA